MAHADPSHPELPEPNQILLLAELAGGVKAERMREFETVPRQLGCRGAVAAGPTRDRPWRVRVRGWHADPEQPPPLRRRSLGPMEPSRSAAVMTQWIATAAQAREFPVALGGLFGERLRLRGFRQPGGRRRSASRRSPYMAHYARASSEEMGAVLPRGVAIRLGRARQGARTPVSSRPFLTLSLPT